jgi:squalene-hopene/tetraprenyl-beta-curcumene cyclase
MKPGITTSRSTIALTPRWLESFGAVILTLLVCSLATIKTFGDDRLAGWRPSDAAKCLDDRQRVWSGYAKCISCHTGLSYALARPALRKFVGAAAPAEEETELLAQIRRRVINWEKLDSKEFGLYYEDSEKMKKQSWGTEAIFNALILALDDQYQGRSSPSDVTRKAFAHLWETQAQSGDDKGSWDWLDFNEPPWGNAEARYIGAALAAIATGSAPGYYTNGAHPDARVNLLRSYLKNGFPKESLHNRVYGLWANAMLPGILTQVEQEKLIAELLDKQQADGGWSLPALGSWRSDGISQDTSSDGYATGVILHVLQTANVPRDHMKITKGLEWLKSHQGATGAWRTVSLFKKRDPTTNKGQFMSDAATAYAVLALTH